MGWQDGCLQGSLKDTFCNQLNHVAFSTQTKGNQHLQGNDQVYNVDSLGGPRESP